MMVGGLAILINREVQNLIRKLTLQMHVEYGLDLVATLLPQHVSLKSSFHLEKIDVLDDYFDSLATSIRPFVFDLEQIELVNFEKDGIMNEVIWINVRENQILQAIHQRINQELKDQFNIPMSPFDGDAYSFHSTLFYRTTNQVPLEIYEKAFQEIKEKNLDLTCVAREIALFCSPQENENLFLSSFSYRILPLGAKLT